MSAAAAVPFQYTPRRGWPAYGDLISPDGGINTKGWHPSSNVVSFRAPRVCEPGGVQLACIIGLMLAARGADRWVELSVGWLARVYIDCSTRAVEDALIDAESRGLIQRQRVTALYEYQVLSQGFRDAPDHARPPLELVEPLPTPKPQPQTRLVEAEEIRTHAGQPVKRYAEGKLLIAEEIDTATVAECGACQEVGIYRMVPAQELEFKEDTPADLRPLFPIPEPQFRNSEEKAKVPTGKPDAESVLLSEDQGAPPATDDPAPPPAAPGKPKFTDARHKAVHKYLCKWKPAFERVPSHKQSLEVAKALGEAPIEYLDRVLRQKGYEWFRNKAQHFGIFVPFARDALSAYVYDAGELCPGCQEDGREQRLKPGDICARCFAPEPEATEPEHEDGDWGPVKVELAKSVPHLQYNTWIEPTWIDSVSGDLLRVGVPNSQTRTCLTGVYGPHVEDALKAAHGDRYSRVEYEVEVQRE